jgi:hypothetical protein
MITESTSPYLYIDWGNDEPGMTLQRWDGKWVDYKVDGKLVKSLVDIDALPIMMWQVCEYGVLSGKTCVDSNCYVRPH